MYGIDVARMQRWYSKTFPQYSGVGFKVVVTDVHQTAIDTDHSLDGVNLDFKVSCYNTTTNAVVHSITNGKYHRKHYGGWDAYDGSNV